MSTRLVMLTGVSVLMLAECVGMELSGSPAPRPGFVGVSGAALLLTVAELFSLGARLRKLEARHRDDDASRST